MIGLRLWLLAAALLIPALPIAALPGVSAQQIPFAGSPGEPGPREHRVTAADDRLAEAERLIAARRSADAIPILDDLLTDARSRGDETLQARTLVTLTNAHYQSADYANTRRRGEETVALAERLDNLPIQARASNLLSMAEDLSGNRDEAETWARRAVDTYRRAGDEPGRLQANIQLSRTMRGSGDARITLLREVTEDARRAGLPKLEGVALHSLGDYVFTAGDADEAYRLLTRALPLLEASGDTVALGTAHNSLGRIYRAHGRLQEALAEQKQALALHEAANDTFSLMQSLNAVGVVYQMLGDVRRAREYTERAVAVTERGGGSPRIRDFLQANLASLLAEDGDYARSIETLQGIVARGLDSNAAIRHNQLAFAYLGLRQPREAVAAAERSLAVCAPIEDRCINALSYRAVGRAMLGDTDAALADLNQAFTQLEGLRARLVPTDFFKQNFHLLYERLYNRAIEVQVDSGHARVAVETAERSRARALLDLLASRAVGSHASAEEMTSNLTRGATTATLTTTAAPSTSTELATAAARLNSTLLSYWVNEREVFIFVVFPDGRVESRRVPVQRAALAALVHRTSPLPEAGSSSGASSFSLTTRGAATLPVRGARVNAWRELYALLIGPVRTLLPKTPGARLTILPHGPLQGLSFAALQNARGRYLLEDFTLHYAPAGALLDYTAHRRRADARTGAILLVADPDLPPPAAVDAPLPRLPGARRETADIQRLAGASHPGITALAGAEATEARIRDAVRDKAVLHFATHAIVRDDAPFASYLALGRSTEGTDGDGALAAQDIYGLRLDADLVVLSACRSAAGTITGDGVSTFARAFLYAGSASLLASQWDVADEPTNRLIPAFYRAWLGGADKAEALRTAQLTLLRDLRAGRVRIDTVIGPVALTEQPVFWAGFGLYGEP